MSRSQSPCMSWGADIIHDGTLSSVSLELDIVWEKATLRSSQHFALFIRIFRQGTFYSLWQFFTKRHLQLDLITPQCCSFCWSGLLNRIMGLPQCQIQLEHQVQLWQCQNRAQGRSRTAQSLADTFETGPPPKFWRQHYTHTSSMTSLEGRGHLVETASPSE